MIKKMTNTLKANIEKDFPMADGSEDLVIFKSTDYSSPQSKDVTVATSFTRKIHRMTETDFVSYYKSNFLNNGVYQNINSAEQIYRIIRNLTTEEIEVRYEHVLLPLATSLRKARVQLLLERGRQLRLNGGLQVTRLDDFIHVPGLSEALKDVFPVEV
jgi:exoribonuclease II